LTARPIPRTDAGDVLRIGISGASGLVGRPLSQRLRRAGHRVLRLVRRDPAGPDEMRFDPATGDLDADRLEGLDALVHLAGASIAAGRWTAERRRRIRDSRVSGTTLLARALAGLTRGPRVLVSASAVGYYGDRGEEILDEDAVAGAGFLAETCVAWEGATAPAEAAGLRVVKLRMGVVLAVDGGALARLLPPFRAGLGGRLGDGRQFMSWISREDLLRVIEHALAHDEVVGPVNAVAPQPVRNADFALTLARVLRRPALLPAPALAIRLLLGQMGRELLLASSRVVPRRLERAGFRHLHPDLESALRSVLGR
jgi:uncharacterized protein (TIGR01777 family)